MIRAWSTNEWPLRHDAVDRHPAARIDQDRFADRELIGVDVADRRLPRRTATVPRQEIEKVAIARAAARDRQALRDLGDQDEQGDHERGEELPDRGRGDDGDGHRQLHGHAPLDDVLKCFPNIGQPPTEQSGDTDDADGPHRLPDAEPHQGCGQRR